MTPNIRSTIYALVAAVMAVLVARNMVTADEAPLWLEVASQLISFGAVLLARHHVTPKP